MLNKKMLLSVLIVGVVASVAGAGTWAYFDSSISVADNTITAGELKISNIATTDKFTVTNAVPGTSGSANTVTVKNAGAVPGELYVTINKVASGDTGITNLQNHLSFKVNDADVIVGTPYKVSDNPVPAEGTEVAITYSYERTDNNAQNNEQGKTAGYTVTYELIQDGITHP